jgi:hypothetical protein
MSDAQFRVQQFSILYEIESIAKNENIAKDE